MRFAEHAGFLQKQYLCFYYKVFPAVVKLIKISNHEVKIMKKIMIILCICSVCFLFTGCYSDRISTHNKTETPENVSQEMNNGLPPIMEIESVVEDNWPESIGGEDYDMTAENLSFEIKISSPTELSISCVTESGKLDMEIKSDDGEKIFGESNIQTEDFEVNTDSPGTYKVIIQAKNHTGGFWIKPQ